MIRWIALFLILFAPAFADMACLVGGSSADALHGGWIDLSTCTIAQATAANGQSLIEMTAVAYDHTGGTVEKMFSKAGIGTGVTVGVYAYVSGTNITAGYYKVTTVAGDGSYVAINVTATDDNADSVVNIGGAVPLSSLQAVSDDPIGSAAALNVTVYCTGSATLADGDADGSGLTIDGNGGSTTTRKRFLAADASYAYAKGGCTLTTTDNLTNGVVSFGSAGAGPVIQYVDLVGFIIDGGAAAGVDAEYGISCMNDNADVCRIIDCTVRDVLEAPGVGIGFGGDLFLVANTEISNCTIGISTQGGDGENNLYYVLNVHDCGDGLLLDSIRAVILLSKFVDNTDDGIYLNDDCDYTRIYDSTFYGNGGDGLEIHGTAYNCEVVACSATTNTGYGYNIGGNSVAGHFWGYNHHYDNTGGICTDTGTWATLGMGGNITGDPLFVSVVDGSEDLNYQHDSPCLGAGIGGATIGAGIHPLDYPLEADVENTVQYSNGELTGTFVGGGGGGFPVTSTIGGHIQH